MERVCAICGKPIGRGERWTFVSGKPAHLECARRYRYGKVVGDPRHNGGRAVEGRINRKVEELWREIESAWYDIKGRIDVIDHAIEYGEEDTVYSEAEHTLEHLREIMEYVAAIKALKELL